MAYTLEELQEVINTIAEKIEDKDGTLAVQLAAFQENYTEVLTGYESEKTAHEKTNTTVKKLQESNLALLTGRNVSKIIDMSEPPPLTPDTPPLDFAALATSY